MFPRNAIKAMFRSFPTMPLLRWHF